MLETWIIGADISYDNFWYNWGRENTVLVTGIIGAEN